MARRKDSIGLGTVLPPVIGRLVDAAEQIQAGPPDDIDFLHAILAQVGLPRRRQEGDTFERTSGSASLQLRSGDLWDGKAWIRQPLPYGTRPRLALIHLGTEAVRTRSRAIDVGHSVREFLLRLGVMTDGREYARFRTQMKALAACEMRLGMGQSTTRFQPIETFEAWLHPTGQQTTLWPGTIELSERFYETLIEHAVPLDHRALAALKHSALALDVYAWLAHRLHRVKGDGARLSWSNLKDQFGQEYGELRDFKREFRKALRQALAVYPDARIEDMVGGVKLLPSKAPVPRLRIGGRRS